MIGRLSSASQRVCFVLFAFFVTSSASLSCWGQEGTPQSPRDAGGAAGAKTPSLQGADDIEDWNVLALAPGSLHARAPLFGEKAVFPTYTRELVELQWRTGDPIDLYIIRPANVDKPPVVLLLYGYPSDTDRFRDDDYCKALAKRGFAAVGFVSALTGHRYHNRPMKEWFVSELPEALGKSVHDVQMILNYLSTRDDLDMKRVGMYGQGSGGTIAILSASVDARIKALDVLDPWGDWPDWMASSAQIPEDERPDYLTPQFLETAAPFDPVRWMPALRGRSFRLQQTLFSRVTPEAARNRGGQVDCRIRW